MKFYNTYKGGFTLIDILLTAAIVSLLSSLFLFQVSEARKKADDSHMKVEAQQVSNAVALYKNDNNGRVPKPISVQPNTVYTETQQEYQDSMQLLVDGGYLPEIPASPDEESYFYAVSEDLEEMAFVASLNAETTEDSIGDFEIEGDFGIDIGDSGNGDLENLLCVSSDGQETNSFCSTTVQLIEISFGQGVLILGGEGSPPTGGPIIINPPTDGDGGIITIGTNPQTCGYHGSILLSNGVCQVTSAGCGIGEMGPCIYYSTPQYACPAGTTFLIDGNEYTANGTCVNY